MKAGRVALVRSLMSMPVITIGSNRSLVDAAKIMKARGIGCLPVVEKGKLVGIITERDFVNVMAEGIDARGKKVVDAMSKPVITCCPDDLASGLIELMEGNEIRHIPVVSEANIVGIVAAYDLALYGVSIMKPKRVRSNLI